MSQVTQKWWSILVVALIASVGAAPASHAQEDGVGWHDLPLYDGTVDRAFPELRGVFVAYNIRPDAPDMTRRRMAEAYRVNAPVILDWEYGDALLRLDPYRSDGPTVTAAMRDALRILRVARAGNGMDVSFYSIGLPVPRNVNVINTDARYPEWRSSIAELSRTGRADGLDLIEQLPRFHPTLYLNPVWTKDWPKWRHNAGRVLDRVCATAESWGKPCVPFVRLNGFDSPESAAEWLSMVLERADGVIVWQKEKKTTDEHREIVKRAAERHQEAAS